MSRCRSSAVPCARQRLPAKIAQEKPIRNSSIPCSLVRATQFFEFFKSIADAATDGKTVHVAPVLFQPVAAIDVAIAVFWESASSREGALVMNF